MYDVFLSFRGDDSRVKFVSHLNSSLQNSAIHVFKDDDEIERGDQISISLLRAIGRSRIALVVLSKKYANSGWCMLELEKIMEIGRARGLMVVPVFYEVDPSEVRHQKGGFGKAFEDLISTISVDESTKSNWRRDLIDIGGIAGFVLKDSRNESDDIKNVVEHVTRLLDRKDLFVADHPVGIESRVQAATKLLSIQNAEDVLLLGIWGMGGIGKTTIAKAIYNEIGSKFDGKSFLLNIREFWETGTNQVSLQQQVLCDVYKTTSFKIRDIESGKQFLPNLEKLVLKDCPSLSAVSHSIGSLQKLLLINLTDCTGLQKIPRSIYKLKSLETLILSGCSKIKKLEEDIEQMESLTTLIADKTAIAKVPFSIVRPKNIGYISLCGFEGFSNDVFPSIIRSWMSPSNNVESLVQTSVFKDLPKLRSLFVECNSKGQLSRNVKNILDVLKATNCHKLDESETISQNSDMFPSLLIDDDLGEVSTGSKNYLKSFLIQMGTKYQVSNIAEDGVLQTTDGTCDSFLLPCDNISDWLTFSCKGSSIIFDVPTMKMSDLKSMMLFAVYHSSSDNLTSKGCQGVLIINYTKKTIQLYKRDTLTSFEDEDWQNIKSNLEPGNEVEVILVFGEGFIVEKTTIYLLYVESTNKEMEHCNAVAEEDAIVSGHDDTDVGVPDGYNLDVPLGNNVTGLGQSTNKEMEHCNSVEEEDAIVSAHEDMDVGVPDGYKLDVPLGNNVTGLGQDENISEDKNLHAMDKSSGDDAMATNKKCACCFWWR